MMTPSAHPALAYLTERWRAASSTATHPVCLGPSSKPSNPGHASWADALFQALLAKAHAQGPWMIFPGGTEDVTAIADTAGVWGHNVLPIHGITTPTIAFFLRDGSVLITQQRDEGLVLYPAVARGRGQPGLWSTSFVEADGEDAPSLHIKWREHRDDPRPRRSRLDAHGLRGTAHTPPCRWMDAYRRSADLLGVGFADPLGDMRPPHLADGRFGPALWPKSGPRHACQETVAQAASALEWGANWLGGAAQVWSGNAASSIRIARPLGYRSGALTVSWDAPTKGSVTLTAERLDRLFPPALAAALAGAARSDLGLAYTLERQGKTTGKDAAKPTGIFARTAHQTLAAFAAWGMPCPRTQGGWMALKDRPF